MESVSNNTSNNNNSNVVLKWHHERKHFEEKISDVYKYRRHRRYIKPMQPLQDRKRGLKHIPAPVCSTEQRNKQARHFPERARARGEESTKFVDRKRIVKDQNGVPCRYRDAVPYNMDTVTGKKLKLKDIIARQGPGYKAPESKDGAEYVLGYFSHAQNGGGVLPGSNFGFSRATETTRESQKVFGKSLAELWNKNPGVPRVVDMCLEYLEQRDILKQTDMLFQDPMFEYFNEEMRHAQGCGVPQRGRRASDSSHHHHELSIKMETGRSRPYSRDSQRTSKTSSSHEKALLEEKAGRKSQIRILRAKFDVGQTKNIDFNRDVTDPRIILGLLVTFLREMKPPVLTYTLYDKIMQTQQEPTEEARLEALRPAIAMLPPANEATLFCLFRYLNQLVKMDREKMIPILAQVFGPLIIRADPRKPVSDFLQDHSVQRALQESVIRCLLENAGTIFPASALRPRKPKAGEIPFHIRRTLSLALQDLESVANLNQWEDQVEIASAMSDRSDSETNLNLPDENPDEPQKKNSTNNNNIEEEQHLDELTQLLSHYADLKESFHPKK